MGIGVRRHVRIDRVRPGSRTAQIAKASIDIANYPIDGATWIGLVLLASMGVDGFGMIVFRAFDVWIVPEATIGILCLVVLLGIFGKDLNANV